MSANTLSPLSRGYGSWTAGYVDPYFGDKQHEHEHETLLPDIDHQSHVHGITVGSRSGRSTAMSYAPTRRSREPTSDGIPLPRTLTTRKGALQIYVAPDDLEDIEGVGLAGDGDGLELRPKYVQVRHPHGKELIDLSLKLGTMERLALSVLQFGDQEYDHEHTSVSDAKNKSFLKFLRSIDGEMPKKSSVDAHLRPGGDLNAYLRDLQSSASSRHPSDGSTYLPKSRESAELQALLRGLDTSGWPHTYGQDGSIGGHGGQFTRPVSRVSSRGGTSPGPPSTPRSSYQVLSAKKLVSSIKSGGYLGRPGSSFSANDDEINTGDSPQHVSSASVSHREWTPTDSTDNQLLDARHSFFCGLEEGDSDSDGKKRMGPREISFNSGLYPGRLARKGEGQGSGLEVKVTGKGESDTRSQGHRSSQMYQIEEEQNIDSVRNNTGEEESLVQDESPDVETEMFDTNSWADKVSPAQNRAGTAQSFVTSTITVPDEETRVIDVEIDEKPVSNNRRGSVKLSSRPSSCKSRPSSARIRPVSGRLRPRSGEARPNSEKSSSSSSSSWVNQSGSRRVSVISLQRFKPVEKPQEESRSNMAIKRGSISYDLGKERRKSLNERRRSSPEHAIQSQQMEVLKTLENVPTVEEMGETVDMDMDLRVTDETPYITDGVENGMSLERDEEKISVARSESRESGIEEMDDELIAEEDIINDIHECNKEIQKIEALADKAKEEVAVDEAPVYEHSDSESSMDEETVQEVLIINSEVRSKTEKGVKEEFVEESTDNINVCGSGIDVGADVGDGLGVGGGVGDDVVGMEDVDNKQMGLEQEYEGQSQGLSEGEGEEEVDEERLSEIRSYKSSKKGRSWKSVSGVEESEDYIDEESRNSSGSLVYKLPTLGSDLLAEQKDAHNIAAELDTLGLRKTAEKPKKGKKEGYTFPLATGRRPKAPQEKAKIPDHLADALSRRPGTSYSKLEEDLEKKGFLRDGKVTSLVGETLSGPTLEAVGEGLTEEELEMAKLILQQKLDEAKGMISGESKEKTGKAVVKKKAPSGKGGKKGGKKKGGADLEEKSSEELEREAIRAKHAEEKELRDEEAANLQRQIAEKRHMLETQSNLTAEKSKELQEKMAELERQAEDLMRAEDEARTILAEVRRKQREERDARRKADLERKRQEAQDRREREKREAEEKASREREMIEKMQDVEMRKLKREEEERRAAEEERLAQERYEAELAENARLEEEQEDRMKELERQAEEEAMMRLVEEREAAERERRRLREQEEALQEHERLKMEALAEEQYKLEAERRRLEDAEQAKRDTERQRLMELRNLEEEARLQMQEEIERRRTDAFTRRDFNLENRSHVDRLKHNQGLTRAWTFSYFVHWPRETYERPIGDPDPRKVVKIKNPMPKKVDPSTEEEQAALAPPNPT
ncbi:trichohyalin-like isoform X5 [Mya arenaria]|uniref:trichohyalin-like isoform X5 n=1 Tax=Mya arenaria TaxID=6604 RepID=UPI0022E5CB8A|nr:trichohyalin-like isoform X5 [Mya arenaria]